MQSSKNPHSIEAECQPGHEPGVQGSEPAPEHILPLGLDRPTDVPQEAGRTLSAINEIIRQLPVGVTVQTDEGKILLANEAAAGQFDGLREQWMAGLNLPPVATEESQLGGRTFLTAHRHVLIHDQRLLLSTSLDITDRKLAEEALLRRAYHDELTQLPNRSLLEEYVQDLLTMPDQRFALAFLDIDNFKHINDYYNHAIGDAVLAKVAQRILENVRSSDLLARVSGDEFLLLIKPLEDEDELAKIINNLVDQLKAPFFVDGFEIFTSASIGVSIYPDHGRDYEELRRNADNAMYQIKAGTKGGAAIFDFAIGETMASRIQLEQRLRRAVRDGRFRCAFQPKVDLRTEGVVGVEALIRLVDEDGVIHMPSSFIGLAIELGLIDDLTHLALRQIIDSIDALNDAFGPEIVFSINVAAKQATDVEFMRSLVDSLKDSNCADRFMIEVTEEAFLAKGQFQTHMLPMLRSLGVRVSIDDFGTGYSSLSALSDIAADEIKIDRSLISNIHERTRSQIVLRAIESLGEALGMAVTAEGVETGEELDYLRNATSIRHAQGYYFARPLFFEDIIPMRRAAIGMRRTTGFRERPAKHRLRGRSY
jgi:cyclic di-GMP phosphodiesterase Gmr